MESSDCISSSGFALEALHPTHLGWKKLSALRLSASLNVATHPTGMEPIELDPFLECNMSEVSLGFASGSDRDPTSAQQPKDQRVTSGLQSSIHHAGNRAEAT